MLHPRLALRLAALAAILAGLLLPSTALADSGSVTNVANAGGGRVQATFTVTSDFCGPSGYCGFFSYARMVETFETCEIGFGKAIWVADDARTTAGTQAETDTFATFDSRPFKICLFVAQADDREYAIAEAVFDPRALPPLPASTPAPQAQQQAAPAPVATTAPSRRTAATLRLATARSRVATALRRRYGRAWRQGKAKRVRCARVSRTSMRCRVSWRHKRSRYTGTVRVTSTVASGIRTRVQVRRSRIR